MEDHTPMDPWPPDREPVAVIGFSFRFGGDAISPDRFWDMIINARCAVSPTPKDRFNAEAFYHPDTNRLDCLPVKRGNFLTEDITSFDAPFFNIKAAEAAAMDPQSRKLLEATYRALENAGIPIEKCAGSNTCIFTGVSADDYRLMYVKDVAYPIRHAATGMASSMLANKISWFYDFKGPSVQLDTACSASLNAAHLAVRSIQSGESEMGIVAGANLYFTPESMAPLAHLNFFSPDSRCYSFDHRANGYSRGDGYGVLVLKSLSKAIADKDPIRAVVRSTASNENGRTTGGITKVNYEAQRALISTAYNSAHLDPALTRYVEAHAPGTQGDVVEAAALAAVLSEYRSKDEPLYMGSVKANVGHLEGTSGIASLIKVVMMLERGIIPRLANFERVHPEILGHEWNMAFPTENIPWPPGKRQASVNSFGFGGANAHAVLQDADAYNVRRQSRHGGEKTTPYVVVISAADECAIERVMSKLRHYSKSKGSLDLMTLQDLVFTLNTRRSKFAWKSTVIITQRADFAQFSNPIRSIRPSPLAFVFTGQGAAWCKMGTQFLYNQVYQDSLQQFSDEMKELGACWNIVDELTKDDIDSNINDAAYSQPICTAVQIALCNMLRSFGICPDYVVGHSSGEIAAAYAAGALSARSACKVAFYRGLLVSQTFREDGKYGMLVVGLSEVQVCEYIDKIKPEINAAEIYIACVNASSNVTLSGDLAHLRVLKTAMQEDSIWLRELPVAVPYHSRILHRIGSEYRTLLGDLERGLSDERSPRMISSVTAKCISTEEVSKAQYWITNMISPVQFRAAVETLKALYNGTASRPSTLPTIVEIGPYAALRTPTRDILSGRDTNQKVTYLGVMDKSDSSANRLFETLGQLYCLGYAVDLIRANELHKVDARCLSDLPEYPFDTSRRYWHESQASKNHRFRKHARHDLLGVRVHDWNPLAPRWRNCIRLLENPWIEDHRLGGALIYPGAGMLVMAIEAVAQFVSDIEESPITAFQLNDVLFHSALNLNMTDEGTTTEMTLYPVAETIGTSRVPAQFHFKLHISEDNAWREVCTGAIAVQFAHLGESRDLSRERSDSQRNTQATFQDRVATCTVPVRRHKLYQGLKEIGLELGPTFQVFDNVRCNRRGQMAAADIRLENWALKGDRTDASPHFVHPTALDGMIQLLIVAFSAGARKRTPTMIPSGIKSLWLSAQGLNGADRITAVSKGEFTGIRHTTSEVLAVNDDTDELQAVFQGLDTVIIETDGSNLQPTENVTAFNVKWQPHSKPLVPPSNFPSSSDKVAAKIVVTTIGSKLSRELKQICRSVVRRLTASGFMDVSLTTLSGFLSQQPASVMHLICIHQVSSTIGKTSEEDFLATRGIVPFSRSVLWVSLPSPTGYPEVTVGHAPAVGIARTIRNEYPDMRFVTLSIAEAVMKHDIETAIIDAAQLHAFQNRDRGGDHEPEFHSEIIENVATLSVPRLSYSHKAAELLNVPSTENVDVDRLFKDPNKPDLALTMTLPGLLDTLTFVPDTQPHKALLPTEILIDPKYVGLNFLDVLTALGQIPQNAVLGIEGAGIVVQAGTASGYQPGDRVAMLADGTLRTSVKADHRTAVKIPDSVTLADAASMAGTACTAYRSLVDIANLDSSESILIHAGAGATGQMAIQMARHIGAEVFTTVGSERKRDLLEVAYHIPASHIFHSRNASFIHAIKRMTNGRGVDVVLNSLSGSLLESAWLESIAPFGRWVEIGKRDIVENRGLPMRPFLNNVTFSCLDLTGLWRHRPQMMQKLLKDVFRLVAQGVLRPPTPIMEFGVNEIRAAFRTLQSNKEGGKVIINMTGQQRLTVKQAVSTDWGFKNKRSYLIVGGFGGLGREVARWMVNRGARYLIIVSRTGAGQDPVRATLLDELRAVGCSPTVMSCNISNKAALQAVLAECEKKLPPIAGCIQASMVLRDKWFADLQLDDWSESTASKIDGSYNLVQLLPQDLDFLIFLSSLAGIAGAPGQSNYAAGCAFQDTLARDQAARGKRCFSFDLGMVVDSGVVAEDESLSRTMESFGHYQPMLMSHVERLLNRYCDPCLPLLSPDECQLVCGIRLPATLEAIGYQQPSWMSMPMFQSLHELRFLAISTTQTPMRESYKDCLKQAFTLDDATTIIMNAILSKLSQSLGISQADIDPSLPVHLYGVDSLVAVELRNWFVNKLKADVAVLHILGDSGVETLARITAKSSQYTRSLQE